MEQERSEQEEAFLAWKRHPVTQAVLRALETQIQEACLLWSRGTFLRQTPEEQAGMLGRIAGYRAVIELEYQELQGIINDE